MRRSELFGDREQVGSFLILVFGYGSFRHSPELHEVNAAAAGITSWSGLCLRRLLGLGRGALSYIVASWILECV